MNDYKKIKNKKHTQNGCCCREELGNNTSTPHPLVLKFIFFFFWPCCRACQILVPRPGIEASPLAVEAQNLNLY